MHTNTKYTKFLLSLSLITTFVAAQALAQQIKPDETKRIELNQAYGKLPLSFEANQGQTERCGQRSRSKRSLYPRIREIPGRTGKRTCGHDA
jgi:hypothetical protein